MQLIGHKIQQEFFTRVIERGELNHAYILVGPAHCGKETLARFTAAKILKTDVDHLAKHPDFLFTERQRDEKTDKLHRDISIKDVREVLLFASQSPLYDKGYKVIIISEADRLNQEAGNALLKMLEEPPQRTIFFLLYSHEAAILPTIRSRAQTVACLPVGISELTATLIERGIPNESAAKMANDSQGLPGLALQWSVDAEAYRVFTEERDQFLHLFGKSFAAKLQAVEPWFAEAKDEGVGPDLLVAKLSIWQAIARTIFLTGALASFSGTDWLALNEQIETSLSDLRRNVHPRLAVEAVLLALP